MRSFLLGAPVDGAFNIPFAVERGGGAPTARDYVQNGLIALWDGKENAGWGVHDATATDWVDLTGGGRDWVGVAAGNTWRDDGLDVRAASERIQDWTISYFAKALEVCGRSDASASYALFSIGNNRRMFGILPTSSRGFQFASGAPSMFQPHAADWTASATWGTDDYPEHTYYNGAEKPHVAGTSTWARISSTNAQWIFDTAYPFRGFVRCIRVYSRALTPAEVAANYAVDKIRFNLP